ncbi:MAG: hypothetical protein RBS05_12440 [Zoogloea oleivorans]|jgi:hypothetical protein|uniref:AcrVA2 family anti-CRISPR protein n=1 Tax=Zoogloea oleivorans TaxID=1552750 RepID=UPI002A3650AE|nr:hypothetical protein [Zoogloea oleivorans]MDY0036709.1 hypothetical protein [Zoogloea oleivorans]
MPTEHRARTALVALSQRLPGIWDDYAAARAESDRPADDGVFITEFEGAGAYMQALYRAGGRTAVEALVRGNPIDVARAVSPANTLATWRMTQGIYRFDPTLYESLIATPLTGDLPADALARLPEWCIYLETPGLSVLHRDMVNRSPLAGAWVRNDIEADGRRVFIVTLDIEGAAGIESQAIVLNAGTLQAAILSTAEDWRASYGHIDVPPEAIQGIKDYMEPVINLVLYIVSTTDITGPGQPANPVPTRTRRHGLRLFAPNGAKTWDVGVRIGSALRAAYRAEQSAPGAEGTGRQVRPHIRRAHWHTILSGPRVKDGSAVPSAQRRRDIRWMPPIPVNLDDLDTLPSVIRGVK